MKSVSVTVKIGSESQTFSGDGSENPLRGVEQAREWMKEQHVSLARKRDKDRVDEHQKTQADIVRKLGRTELADAIEAGDRERTGQLEAKRLERLGEIADREARNIRPEVMRVKAGVGKK